MKWERHEIGLIIAALLLVLFLGSRAWSADLIYKFGPPEAVDSVQFVWVIDQNWAHTRTDSSGWYEDFGHIITDTLSYVDGDYIDVWIEYKYSASDTLAMVPYFSYNSAAASTLDSVTVAGAVYDVASGNPSLFLGGTGSGAYSVTVVTYDSTISQAIPGVKVVVWDVAQSATQAGPVKTGIGGDTTFNLDAGNYVYIAKSPGYTFPTYDTVSVSGSQTDTIFGDQFDPGSPAGASFCRVYGWISELRDTTTNLVGNVRICFESKSAVRNACDSTWPIFYSVCTRTDSSGYFSQDLLYSSCLLDRDSDTTTYKIYIEGQDIKKTITVPDASSYRVTWE